MKFNSSKWNSIYQMEIQFSDEIPANEIDPKKSKIDIYLIT